MNYGKAIKIVRAAHGLNQAQLAERLSVGPSHLSLIEAGKREPSLKVLEEIATVLAVPPHLLRLLAYDQDELEKRGNPEELAQLAKSLLQLLTTSGEQRTLPIASAGKEKKSRVG